MKIPQIPPLDGMTPLGVKPKAAWIQNSTACHLVGEVPELFEAPFNLAGELIDNGVTNEGQARIRAIAEAEARKAQHLLDLDTLTRVPFDLPMSDAEREALYRAQDYAIEHSQTPV